MKFLSMEWWRKCQTDESIEDIYAGLEGARAHDLATHDRLPLMVQEFKNRVALHDGLFHDLRTNVNDRTVELTLTVNMCQSGHHRCVVTYDNVSAFEVRNPGEGFSIPAGLGSLGYDEYHLLEDATIEHHILFSSAVELVVRFSDLSYTLSEWDG